MTVLSLMNSSGGSSKENFPFFKNSGTWHGKARHEMQTDGKKSFGYTNIVDKV